MSKARSKQKRVGKYEISKTLGEGTFGKVKLAVNLETGEQVAVKILDKERIQHQNMGQQIKKEISIMKQLKNPHVVQMKEVLASRTKIFIVIEFISGGELFEEIVRAGRFDEDEARKYFRQMIDGIDYCHKQGVCHRDLKPENLLLDSRKNLKISDFGLSNFIDGGETAAPAGSMTTSQLLHTTCGTPNYVAPEVLADKGYDGKMADIWSCGVILYVLLAGFLPFDEKVMSELFRKIQRAEFAYPPWFTKETKSLLGKILVTDPAKRITISEIQKDPWFTKNHDNVPIQEYEQTIKVTDADLRSAVSTVQMTTAHDADTAPATTSSAPTMNAFDLITMVGGLALDNLFNYHKGAHVSWKRFSYFVSSLPVPKIIMEMKNIMKESGMATLEKERPHSLVFKVKRKGCFAEVSVDIFMVLKSLHIVEVRRCKGDAIAYYKFLADTIGPKISAKISGNKQQGPSGVVVADTGAPALPKAS